MKTKASALLVFLLCAMASTLFGQAAPDCYDIKCPSKIFAPCEGTWGARVWYSVTASNLCDPANPPIVTYSVAPGSIFASGTNVVCATIQIPGTPPRTCCWEVIVERCCATNCIEVICPRDIVVGCTETPLGTGAFVDLPHPTATNYCGDHVLPSDLHWRCLPDSPQPGQQNFFPPGTHHVVCCLVDGQGKIVACCCYDVVVTNCPPQTGECVPKIICPTDISVQCEGYAGGIAFFPPPQVIDPCHLVIATNYTHTSGSFFPNGKTTVGICIMYRNPATGALLTECCCFDVVVRCCPPTNCVSRIDCPPDMLIECPPAAGIPLNYTVFGTNTCEQTQVICNPPPGSIIYGPTNVCCKLVNSANISLADCCFKVAVKDDLPPQIDCPPNLTFTSPDCKPVNVALPVVTAKDDCDPNPTVTCAPIPTTGFPCGVTTITCYATDSSGNSNKCSFDVVVLCSNRTEIVCPEDILIRCAAPTGAVVNYSISATNHCTNIVSTGCTPPSGSVFLPGSHPVCCWAVDGFGETNRCCFKVTVEPDDIPPVIVCPPDITVLSPNCTEIPVQYPPPGVTENCQIDHVICTPPSASPFPVGTTTVKCCAWDRAGNSNCCTFKITVRCDDCIRVYCPPGITNECGGPNGAVVTFDAFATNTCTGGVVPLLCTPPSGSNFPLGVSKVCCTNLSSGIVRYCCFDVTVRPDTIPPVITCPPDMTVISPNCTKIDVLYPNPTATDNCKVDHIICTPPSGSPFSVGVTPVTCCAWDTAGNSNCCTFKVIVRCQPPDCIRVYCPSNITVNCAGPNGAVVNYDAYATNVCNGNSAPLTCSRPSGSPFPIGVTTVCCTNVTGTAVQWCCFDVTVRPDTEPPVLNCPTNNIFILCAKPNGQDVKYDVTATDNCDPTPTVTCIPPTGSHFNLGCTNVTCVAVDDAGNAATCTFKVCLVRQGCYLFNPSFELLSPNLPAANACGDPIAFAQGWSAIAGTPDLWRPPFASFAPGNCRGMERPCDGTNYAGLEGGYTSSGGFATEEMMGTLIAPLGNGQKFRLRACLSLAESSSGPVFIEFVLVNSANLAQQQVIHQVWVTQVNGWMQYLPPCFTVPTFGNWDRLIIRASQVPAGTHPYKTGYVYVDNVNICCCKPVIHTPPTYTDTTITVVWEGRGQLQATEKLGDPSDWFDVMTPVDYDSDSDTYRTTMPRPAHPLFFRVASDGDTVGCSACGP